MLPLKWFVVKWTSLGGNCIFDHRIRRSVHQSIRQHSPLDDALRVLVAVASSFSFILLFRLFVVCASAVLKWIRSSTGSFNFLTFFSFHLWIFVILYDSEAASPPYPKQCPRTKDLPSNQPSRLVPEMDERKVFVEAEADRKGLKRKVEIQFFPLSGSSRKLLLQPFASTNWKVHGGPRSCFSFVGPC